MFGLGVLKGLGITLKHFIDSYIDDFKYMYAPGRTRTGVAMAQRQGPEARGLFTVEYPEVKLHTPENFRFLPFLITDYDVPKDSLDYNWDSALEQNRCTSCGICAKVCPPQCIWIVRTDDPKTGKPIPQPAEFYIDTDICMNCGYCAEFCPFDAIKMDHDFELADYERAVGHIHDLDRLLKPISYYAAIRPTWNAKEEAARRAAEEEKERKAAEKAAGKAAPAPAAAPTPAATAMAPSTAVESSGDGAPKAGGKRSPEEIKAMREAMMAKKQQKTGQGEAPAVEAEAAASAEIKASVVESTSVPAADKAKRTPEEIKAQREAMMARRAQKATGVDPEVETAASTPVVEPPPAAEAVPTPVKRTPEEIKAQREAMMARRAQRATGETVEPEVKIEATESQVEPRPPVQSLASVGPDDLKVIEGIGPKIAALLQAQGITTFAQLAETNVDRLEQILVEANLRRLADPATWPEQAKLAAAGDWEAFKKLTDELKGGRRG